MGGIGRMRLPHAHRAKAASPTTIIRRGRLLRKEPGSAGVEPGSAGAEPGSAGAEPGSAGVEPGSAGAEPGSAVLRAGLRRGGAGLRRGGARLLRGWSRAPQGESRAPQGGSRGARLRFGLLAGSWARATWPDWLCRICSPQPPYPPSKAHFPPPVGVVREVNKSGTADTALKTRLPSIYSGAPHRLRTGSTPGSRAPPEGSRPKFLGELPLSSHAATACASPVPAATNTFDGNSIPATALRRV